MRDTSSGSRERKLVKLHSCVKNSCEGRSLQGTAARSLGASMQNRGYQGPFMYMEGFLPSAGLGVRVIGFTPYCRSYISFPPQTMETASNGKNTYISCARPS